MSDTLPESPGGTTVENDIETVTVTASRLPNWQKIALVILAAFVLYRISDSR